MRIEIFTPDLSNRHEITNAISVQFAEPYNDVGKFSIDLPMDDYNIGISEVGALVYIVEKKLAYEVAEVVKNCDENEITLNGYTLNNILNRRIISAPVNIVNVENDVYNVVSTNLRDLPVQLAEKQGLSETITATQIDSDELLSEIMPVLDKVELGQRATFDYKTKTITWGIYKGVDRTSGLQAVSFVQERGTAPGLSIDQDASEYKNVCYCSAEYEQKTRSQASDGTQTEITSKIKFTVTVGDAQGGGRREMFLKYSGDSQVEGESYNAFYNRVQAWAQAKLNEYKKRLGFSVDADASEIGAAYNVGDLVWCVSLRHNVKFKARITEAVYSQDVNGQTTSITVGDPMLTVPVR